MIKLKSLWMGVCMVVLLLSCRTEKEVYLSTSFHEPATEGLRFIYSEDGIHWDSIAGVWLKPEVGKQKIMRDPSIVRSGDGTFHLVWTSSWKGDLGFGYAHSKDLIHWSEEKFIPVMAHDSTTVNVWAPELFYDDEKDEFMVVWASCIPYKFEKGIEDEFNNHRLYYITTKDFDRISDTRLYYDPGYSAIDATLVKRTSKDYVLVVKDNTRNNRNINIMISQCGRVKAVRCVVFPCHMNGSLPHAFYRGNRFFHFRLLSLCRIFFRSCVFFRSRTFPGVCTFP